MIDAIVNGGRTSGAPLHAKTLVHWEGGGDLGRALAIFVAVVAAGCVPASPYAYSFPAKGGAQRFPRRPANRNAAHGEPGARPTKCTNATPPCRSTMMSPGILQGTVLVAAADCSSTDAAVRLAKDYRGTMARRIRTTSIAETAPGRPKSRAMHAHSCRMREGLPVEPADAG